MTYFKFIVAFFACLAIVAPARADDLNALTLTVSNDRVRIADALTVLQKESGKTIVVDPTVIGTLNIGHVALPTLARMLDFLKTTEPGLTYVRIYLPASRPVPSADQCYDIVRTLTWLSMQGDVSMASQSGTIGVVHDIKQPDSPPSGAREIWYISDEQERTQLYLDAQKAEKDRLLAASQSTTQQQTPTTQRRVYPGVNSSSASQWQRPQPQQNAPVQVSPGLTLEP